MEMRVARGKGARRACRRWPRCQASAAVKESKVKASPCSVRVWIWGWCQSSVDRVMELVMRGGGGWPTSSGGEVMGRASFSSWMA